MTPEQIAKLLELMARIADRQYTITGASDWPILLAVGGLLCGLLGLMWSDLRGSLRDSRQEWKEAVAELKREEKIEHDILWAALRDCQDDCCPRGYHARAIKDTMRKAPREDDHA